MGIFNFGKKAASEKYQSLLTGEIDFRYLSAPDFPWPKISSYSQLKEIYPKGDFITLPQEVPVEELKKYQPSTDEKEGQKIEKDVLLFYERVWGVIRRGKFEFDAMDYSLKRCCERATKDIEIEAVYSETAVSYYLSGRREVHKVMPTGVYNTDIKYPKWTVETTFAIRRLFPEKKNYFDKLQRYQGTIISKFLVSPDKTKFICAVDMDNISPGSFSDVRSLSFHTGLSKAEKMIPHNVCLRSSFYWFCVMVENGYYEKISEHPGFEFQIGCTTKNINLNIGSVNQKKIDAPQVKNLSMPKLSAQLEIRKRFLVNDLGNNWKNDNVQIFVPLSVYQNWGMPFDKDEMTEMSACINFRYSEKHEGRYARYDLLRYTPEKLEELAKRPFYQRVVENLKGGVANTSSDVVSQPQTPIDSPTGHPATEPFDPLSFFKEYTGTGKPLEKQSSGIIEPLAQPEAHVSDSYPKMQLLQRHLPFIVWEAPNLMDLYHN